MWGKERLPSYTNPPTFGHFDHWSKQSKGCNPQNHHLLTTSTTLTTLNIADTALQEWQVRLVDIQLISFFVWHQDVKLQSLNEE